MVSITRLLQLSPSTLPPYMGLTKFVVLQEILYQPFFALIRLMQKQCIFKVKQFFSFNFMLVGLDFTILCLFFRALPHSSTIIKLQIASYLASHQIM